MPLPIVAEALSGKLGKIPYAFTILKATAWIAVVYLLRVYFGGAINQSERNMHSKVVMLTVSRIGCAN